VHEDDQSHRKRYDERCERPINLSVAPVARVPLLPQLAREANHDGGGDNDDADDAADVVVVVVVVVVVDDDDGDER